MLMNSKTNIHKKGFAILLIKKNSMCNIKQKQKWCSKCKHKCQLVPKKSGTSYLLFLIELPRVSLKPSNHIFIWNLKNIQL